MAIKNPERGIICPVCGCADLCDEYPPAWYVYKSLKLSGRIRRYRICRHCGKRVRTIEKIDKKQV